MYLHSFEYEYTITTLVIPLIYTANTISWVKLVLIYLM